MTKTKTAKAHNRQQRAQKELITIRLSKRDVFQELGQIEWQLKRLEDRRGELLASLDKVKLLEEEVAECQRVIEAQAPPQSALHPPALLGYHNSDRSANEPQRTLGLSGQIADTKHTRPLNSIAIKQEPSDRPVSLNDVPVLGNPMQNTFEHWSQWKSKLQSWQYPHAPDLCHAPPNSADQHTEMERPRRSLPGDQFSATTRPLPSYADYSAALGHPRKPRQVVEPCAPRYNSKNFANCLSLKCPNPVQTPPNFSSSLPPVGPLSESTTSSAPPKAVVNIPRVVPALIPSAPKSFAKYANSASFKSFRQTSNDSDSSHTRSAPKSPSADAPAVTAFPTWGTHVWKRPFAADQPEEPEPKRPRLAQFSNLLPAQASRLQQVLKETPFPFETQEQKRVTGILGIFELEEGEIDETALTPRGRVFGREGIDDEVEDEE